MLIYDHFIGGKRVYFIKKIRNLIQRFLLNTLSLFINIGHKKNLCDIIISSQVLCPWKKDKKFLSLYKKFENFTCLDIKRAYTIYHYSNELKYKSGDILDIGTMQGGSGFLLSSANKKGKTLLIDTFEGYMDKKTQILDGKKEKSFFIYSDWDQVKKNVKKFSLKNTVVLKNFFPKNFEKLYKLKSIKLCHIDCNTYDSVLNSFKFVDKRMVKGGYIIFDDYGIPGNLSVEKVIKKIKKRYIKKYAFFENYNSQIILFRI
jgi:O-methyltransferase